MTKEGPPNIDSLRGTNELVYTFFKSLGHEHLPAASVTCVAFSPDGAYIACGADDGQVSVWSNSDSLTLLHIISGKPSVKCIKWLNEDCLVGGMEDGALAYIYIDKVLCNPPAPHPSLKLTD